MIYIIPESVTYDVRMAISHFYDVQREAYEQSLFWD